MSLTDIQPSQLYISIEKLAFVRRTFRPIGLRTLPPIPVVELDGRIVATDGHTRALAAFLAGMAEVAVYWDRDELDWEAYRICVGWCQDEGIRCPSDLKDRVVGAAAYRTLWLDRCLAMQRELSRRSGHDRS